MASAESLLLSGIISNSTKRELAKANFTSENMAKYKDEMFFILQSRNIPSRKVFKAKFPNFIISKDILVTDIPNLIDQCKDNKIKADLSTTILGAAKQMKDGEDPKKVLATLEREARLINSQFGNTIDIEVMSNLGGMYINRYMDRRNKVKEGGTTGIPYGINTIDKLTGGMQDKELITIAARVKVGKSWTMCKMAASAIMAGYSPLYLSLEMDWDAVANRIFSIISYEYAIESYSKEKGDKKEYIEKNVLQNNELNLGKLPEKKVARILSDIRNRIKGNLYVPDIRGRFSINESQRKIEILEPDVVFFDYFGLTQQSGNSKGIDNWVQASDASKLAKEIARTYNLPYVLGAQVNRTGATADSPKLEHISLTDSIGQDSDKVFMLKTRGRRNTIEMICEKFRGSYDNWRVQLSFDVNNGELSEISVSGLGDDEEDGD